MCVHVPSRTGSDDTERCPGFLTQLVLSVAQGDEAALGRLYDVALPVVLTIIGRSVTSPTTIDAFVLEAFVRIWRHAPRFDPAQTRAVEWLTDQVVAVVGPGVASAGPARPARSAPTLVPVAGCTG